MCGIAGCFGPSLDFQNQATLGTLGRMIDSIAHRGPDSDGVWADPEAGIALGHRRLAIIDVSEAGAQPMVSASGRFVVVYNGEIYNHQDLRDELEAAGPVPWRGHSDTETMLAGFEAWGIEATIRRSIGMFAIAVWDRRERVLTLVRDRMGEKPLYYGWQGEGRNAVFLFGSELKALRAHPAFADEIDRDALCLLLSYRYIGGTHSIYRGIQKLPPGSIARLSHEQPVPVVDTYWSAVDVAAAAAAENTRPLSETEAVDALEEVLTRSVARQMIADVPVGAFLSGGIDSSTIVALMQHCSNVPVRTFTIGMDEPRMDEAAHARRVAEHLGTEHTELYLGMDDLLAILPELPQIYDEPLADASQIPTLLISRLARQHVTVSLSGDGGDELFCGYDRYDQADRFWRHVSRAAPFVRRAAERAATAVPESAWDRLLKPLKPESGALGQRIHRIAGYGRSGSLHELQLKILAYWPDPPVIGGAEPPWALTADNVPDTLSGLDQMMLRDIGSFLADDVLTKVDRASMSVSLESRAPLLDHTVVEFAVRQPAALKLREGRSKWLLRQVLYRHVPEAIVDRPKAGFSVPVASWLRGPLRDWAENLLDPVRLGTAGYLDPEPVRRKWLEHQSGSFDWHNQLWSVLMFQAWLEAERDGRSSRHAAAAGGRPVPQASVRA